MKIGFDAQLQKTCTRIQKNWPGRTELGVQFCLFIHASTFPNLCFCSTLGKQTKWNMRWKIQKR